jgi:glutathione S-transferase
MPKPTLVTIRVSHYCEKARWALERAGVGFVEEAHPPLLHLAATVPRGGRSVPMLVTPHGTLRDSVAILAHADRLGPKEKTLFPEDPRLAAEAEALCKRFDADLGPAVRRILYDDILGVPALERAILLQATRPWEARLIAPFLGTVAKAMRRSMRIDAAGVARSREKLDAVLGDVDALLADGRRFLVGERFSVADLTFCALFAPAVYAPEYGCPLPPLEQMPLSLQELVASYRARPAGQFVLSTYARERRS